MYKDIIDAYYIGYNAADETKHLYFTFHKTICDIEKDECHEHNEGGDDIENNDEYKYLSLACTKK